MITTSANLREILKILTNTARDMSSSMLHHGCHTVWYQLETGSIRISWADHNFSDSIPWLLLVGVHWLLFFSELAGRTPTKMRHQCLDNTLQQVHASNLRSSEMCFVISTGIPDIPLHVVLGGKGTRRIEATIYTLQFFFNEASTT